MIVILAEIHSLVILFIKKNNFESELSIFWNVSALAITQTVLQVEEA